MNGDHTQPNPPSDENEFDIRRRKLDHYRDHHINPFAYECPRTHSIDEALTLGANIPAGQKIDQVVAVTGRIMAKRGHGKAMFGNITDHSGTIQVYANVDELTRFEAFTWLDVGDIIGVEGTLFCTRRGQITINIQSFTLLTKALHPLPEKYHGLQDKERRYRQRYVDLMVNEDVMTVFKQRSRIIHLMRSFLAQRDFMEVETPVLHHIHGGAAARPFVTHHNDLDQSLSLRIALELHLKRLIVGGMHKVFEIGRVFRNEGVSFKHNPEYTLLELYEAYADYTDMMDLTEALIRDLATQVCGAPTIEYQGVSLDFSVPFQRITMKDAIIQYANMNIDEVSNDDMRRCLQSKGIECPDQSPRGELINAIYDAFVEDQLIQPTFIMDHPIDTSPLAKKHRHHEGYVERFELIIHRMEIANAFTELNDPIDQEQRFNDQQVARDMGFDEAHQMDRDFITALSYGMPPTGGLGIGVDRVAMLLTNAASIRDVLLFPHLKHTQ